MFAGARTYYHTRCIYMLINKQYKTASFIAIFKKKKETISYTSCAHTQIVNLFNRFRYAKLDSVNGWLPPRTSLLTENSLNHKVIEHICAKIGEQSLEYWFRNRNLELLSMLYSNISEISSLISISSECEWSFSLIQTSNVRWIGEIRETSEISIHICVQKSKK